MLATASTLPDETTSKEPTREAASRTTALALEHFRAGRVDEADRLCRDALATGAESAWANHLVGLIALGRGRTDEGLAAIKRSLALDPSVDDFLFNHAFARISRSDPLTTLIEAARAISVNPAHGPSRLLRGEVMAKISDEPGDDGRVVSRARIVALLDSLEHISSRDYYDAKRGQVNEFVRAQDSAATIEINDSCNIDCVMCRTSEASRPKGLMKLSLFEEIVAKLARSGPVDVALHTIGDPLANKRLPDYLAILRKHGGIVRFLSSNCLMMDRHIDTLFEYRDIIGTIRPSIDAASKQVYELIRFGGKWETLIENLNLFAERNRRSNNPFPVFVNNTISKDNFHEIGLIPEVFSFLTSFENFGFGFVNSLAPRNDYFFAANYFEEHYVQNSPCGLLWNRPHILKDGSITTCCRDYNGELIFGDFKTETVDTALNNEHIRALRRAHIANDTSQMPELCRKCYVVDERLDTLLNEIFQYFARFVRSGGRVLQQHLDQIGPLLKGRDYRAVLAVVDSM
ncbi:MAG: radical SAM protein [Alphaproteobacteria bacterium]|nr:radical SAM protein [Alphaproteobacteria bacterium]